MIYSRLQRKLMADEGAPIEPALFEQMSGRNYRRLSAAAKAFVFREPMWFVFLLAVALLSWRLGGHHSRTSPRPFAIYTQWETPFLFLSMLLAGGWIQPSPWRAWLANTAKRGFLRDLYLSAMTPRDIITSHFAARFVPTHANGWIFFTFFAGFIIGLDPRQQHMKADMTRVGIIAISIISLMIIKQSMEYGLYAAYSERGYKGVLSQFFARINGYLIFVPLLAWLFHKAPGNSYEDNLLYLAVIYIIVPVAANTKFELDQDLVEKQWEAAIQQHANRTSPRVDHGAE